MAALRSYSFPGNVRELKNIIERALIESGGETILADHLHLLRSERAPASAADDNSRKQIAASLPLNLAEAEDVLIQRALEETKGNIAEAARLLGVHRTRIYRKLAQEEAHSGNLPLKPADFAKCFRCFTGDEWRNKVFTKFSGKFTNSKIARKHW